MFTLDHITISVKSLEPTVLFYQHLGFEVVKSYKTEDQSFEMLMLENQEGRFIELFYYKNSEEIPLKLENRHIGMKHFALRTDDIEKAHDYIIDKRLAERVEIKMGKFGRKYFFLTDPNGVLVEIIES